MKALNPRINSGVVITTSYEVNNDNMILLNMDCAGTVGSPSATIPVGTEHETVVVAKYINASNDTVAIGTPVSPDGRILEIVAEGGTVNVVGTFLSGAASYSFSDGIKLRLVRDSSFNVCWAKVG